MAEKIHPIKKGLTEAETATLLLVLALIVGAWLRLTPLTLADFPINDGGMFYAMISDLGDSHYALPAFTAYNGGTIPFAYPPLGFYLARFCVDIFHFSILQTLLWLPVGINILAILAFYLMARELLGSNRTAAIATLIFAISPRSFSWFIMGGGLTRALGQLGLFLTLYSAQRLFSRSSTKHLWLTILFGSLTVLSHPEAALHTIGAAFLLWLTSARSKTTLIDGLKVSAGVILLTSPWWGNVLRQHGASVFLNASQTGFPFLFFAVIPFYFTEEPMMTIISVLGILGLFAQIARRNYFLPAWILVSFLLEARSAAWVANLSIVMLAAVALDKVIIPGFAALRDNPVDTNKRSAWGPWPAQALLGYFLLYVLGSSYLYTLSLASVHLASEQREAMVWVQSHTPANSKFILLTPVSDYPMRDPIQEWFPALTQRISLTTLQGQEWTFGPNFSEAMAVYKALQACASQTIECVDAQTSRLGLTGYDYIYINKKSEYQLGLAWPNIPYSSKLAQSIQDSSRFTLAYENQAATIFFRK